MDCVAVDEILAVDGFPDPDTSVAAVRGQFLPVLVRGDQPADPMAADHQGVQHSRTARKGCSSILLKRTEPVPTVGCGLVDLAYCAEAAALQKHAYPGDISPCPILSARRVQGLKVGLK